MPTEWSAEASHLTAPRVPDCVTLPAIWGRVTRVPSRELQDAPRPRFVVQLNDGT